jgi:predicted RNA-binding Zn ribbon-like protein
MAVSWTPHRFTGGALALDVANTVVLRHDPVRRFDRFDVAAELPRFAAAASVFRKEELAGRSLAVADPAAARSVVLPMREATDLLFRQAILAGSLDTLHFADLLATCAIGLDGARDDIGAPGAPFGIADLPLRFEAAVAISAVSLLEPPRRARIRICAHCGWLFLDRSRNRSRVWCDMTVCGNRTKARRHYLRQKEASDA